MSRMTSIFFPRLNSDLQTCRRGVRFRAGGVKLKCEICVGKFWVAGERKADDLVFVRAAEWGCRLGTTRDTSRRKGGKNMAIAPALQRHMAARPRTKREADVVALKLFCLFSFILVGLIMAGVL